MKNFCLSLILISSSFFGFSQSTNAQTTLFGQCMIEVNSAEEMQALETEMKTNPNIKLIRLDYNTQRAFILTKNLEELSVENFTSWFMSKSDKVRCIQIGKQGVDVVNPFPFEGCEK